MGNPGPTIRNFGKDKEGRNLRKGLISFLQERKGVRRGIKGPSNNNNLPSWGPFGTWNPQRIIFKGSPFLNPSRQNLPSRYPFDTKVTEETL